MTTEHLYKHRIVVIRDLFGNITLSQLSHAILQKKIDEYGETRQKTTVNVLLITVKASLKDALYDGYIPRDIFSRVKPHSDLEPVNKIKALSATDFEKLQNYLFTHYAEYDANLALLVLLETGMRVGEALALNYNDINALFDSIAITKTYSTAIHTMTKPKTKTSTRNVKITHELAQLLVDQKDRKNSERYFTSTLYPVEQHLKSVLKALKLPQITVHGLRHSHASYLLYKGVSVNYVSERLGHANTAITQLVYSHMLSEERSKEADKTVKILSKSPIVPKAQSKHRNGAI